MITSTHPVGERMSGGDDAPGRASAQPDAGFCQLCDGLLDLSTATAFDYWADCRRLVHDSCLAEHRRIDGRTDPSGRR